MRRRLTLLSAATSLLITLAFVIPLALVVRELAHDRAVTRAENDAQVLALSLTTADDDELVPAARSLITGTERAISVILPNERVIGEPLQSGEDISLPLAGTAGRAVLTGGEAVYTPALGPDGISVVRVFVEDEELMRGVTSAWVVLGLLGLGLVALAMTLSDRMGKALRQPIDELATAARRIGAGDLHSRVDPSGPPDLETVGRQFNRMAEDVGRLLQRERELAADLSHRLRTPMMAMRLGIDGLATDDERERLLADLATLEEAVDGVIEETRRPETGSLADPVPLVAIVEERVVFWQALAEEQQREASFDAPSDEVLVQVRRADLVAALDALLGNVFTHTPEGTPYAVAIETDGNTARVHVDDAGPGIPQAAAERGVSGAGSTGLGLDIVHRIVSAAGGSTSISRSPLGGARITIRLAGRTS